MKDIKKLWSGRRAHKLELIKSRYRDEMGFESSDYLELTRYYIHKLESDLKSINEISEGIR